MRTRAQRVLAGVGVAALLLTACDGGDENGDASALDPVPADAAGTPTSGLPPTTPDATDTTTPELRGTPHDLPLPTGSEFGVFGVEAGDVLNVRAGPGPNQPIVTALPPLATGITVTGLVHRLDDASWAEVRAAGTRGWVNIRFIGPIAATHDVTSSVGELAAQDLRGLAESVLIALAYDSYPLVWGRERDPDLGVEEQRRVVISEGPTVGAVASITVDVIDLFDDSIAGERLAIRAASDASGDGFTVSAVELTPFCHLDRAGFPLCT